jgi:hypothetical protein
MPGQELPQASLSREQCLSTKILSVEPEEIEGIEAERPAPAH